MAFVLLIVLLTAGVANQAPVAADAREILEHRLTAEHIRGVAAVIKAMDGLPDRGPEMPRDDVTVFTVLAMSLPYSNPYTDQDVTDMVQSIGSGMPALSSAISKAGISQRDYVLTQIVLLLTYPVAVQQRAGKRTERPFYVSAENAVFLAANWSAIDQLVTDLTLRVAAARRDRP